MISRSPKTSRAWPVADRADAPQQGPDASRQLLRGERLGEVVVGARLEPGDDVVGVVAGGDHHDRHVAVTAQRAAQLEAVDARQHDVDQHHVGQRAVEQVDRVLAAAGLVDGPALVLERQLHRRADALVVFDGQDAGSHGSHDASDRRPGSGVAPASKLRPSASNNAGLATEHAASGRTGPPSNRPVRQPASRAISSPAAPVPRSEPLLEVHVDAPGGDVAQVGRGCPEPADVADPGDDLGDARRLRAAPLELVAEPGGDERVLQRRRRAAADRRAVEPRATARA